MEPFMILLYGDCHSCCPEFMSQVQVFHADLLFGLVTTLPCPGWVISIDLGTAHVGWECRL